MRVVRPRVVLLARVPEEPLEVAQNCLQEHRQEHRLPEGGGGLGAAALRFGLNVCVSHEVALGVVPGYG